MGQVTASITDDMKVARQKYTMFRKDVPTVVLLFCISLVHVELDNIHTIANDFKIGNLIKVKYEK